MASPAFRSFVEFAYQSSGTSETITKPSGTAENDVLLFVIYVEDNASAKTFTWPSGFTELFSSYNDTVGGQITQVGIAWKLAGGSEPADYTVSWTTSAPNSGRLAAYSGGYTVDPIDDSAASIQSGTSTSQTCPSVTAAAADTLLTCWGAQWQGGNWTESTDLTMRDSTGVLAFGDVAVAGTGATGTRVLSHNDAGGRTSISVLIASQAAGGAATNTGWAGGGWW